MATFLFLPSAHVMWSAFLNPVRRYKLKRLVHPLFYNIGGKAKIHWTECNILFNRGCKYLGRQGPGTPNQQSSHVKLFFLLTVHLLKDFAACRFKYPVKVLEQSGFARAFAPMMAMRSPALLKSLMPSSPYLSSITHGLDLVFSIMFILYPNPAGSRLRAHVCPAWATWTRPRMRGSGRFFYCVHLRLSAVLKIFAAPNHSIRMPANPISIAAISPVFPMPGMA